MTTYTRKMDDGEAKCNRPKITPTQMFTTLSQERRQHALTYLAQKAAAIPLGDLAEYIALKEGEPTRDQYERILTDLYHCHVPQMVDVGLVRYDAERELLELQVDVDDLAPYLRLVVEPNAQ